VSLVGHPEIDGHIGHHGAMGCQLACPMKGHHKPNAGHYFAIHLKPDSYSVWCHQPWGSIRAGTHVSCATRQESIFSSVYESGIPPV
jgi:hypothetical protein